MKDEVRTERDDEDEVADAPPAKLLCPKCGSADVRRSGSEGFVVSVNQLLGRWPYRCRSCRGRFFRPGPAPSMR